MAKLNELDIKTLALECLQDKYIWPASFHAEQTRETTPLVFRTNEKTAEEKLVLVQVGSKFLAKLNAKEVDTKLTAVALKMKEDARFSRRLNKNILNLKKANAINDEEAMSIKNVVKTYTRKVSNVANNLEDMELTAK